MFGQSTYLLWLCLLIGIPLLILLHWRDQLWRQRRALGLTPFGLLVGGWVCDAPAVRFELWYYDPATIAGIWWLRLPLEEWPWVGGVTLLFGGITVMVANRLGVSAEDDR